MKKKTIITAICLIIAATLHSYAITPLQLKQARMAVYQWYGNYEDRIGYTTRYDAVDQFLNLFKNDSIILSDDLIFRKEFDFENQSITAEEYANRLLDVETLYIPVFKCSDMRIEGEKIDSAIVHYTISFNKVISAGEKGVYTNDRRSYPDYNQKMMCYLEYNITSKEIYSDGIFADPIEEFVVLKEDGEYSYTTKEQILQLCKDRSKPLIHYYAKADVIDSKIQSIYSDTLKFNVHFGPIIGFSWMLTDVNKSLIQSFSTYPSFAGSFNIGVYVQCLLKGKNRIGVEVSPTFTLIKHSFGCDYMENYYAIDPDGGPYLRYVTMSDYTESINRYQVVMPVALRYDYFIKNNLSLFARLGLTCSYDMVQNLKAMGNATYSGYYDWLFGVTISQNGIYNFGQYDFNHASNKSALGKFGMSAFVGFGVQYYIPNTKWSIESSLIYSNMFYQTINSIENFHLSDSVSDWNSLTNMFQGFNTNKMSIMINFNRNF